MAVVEHDAGAGSTVGTSRPASARLLAAVAGMDWLSKVWWTCLSVGLFAGIWELCWAMGWADPQLLPPPHIFLSNFGEQGKFFNTATRWQVGQSMGEGPSAFESVMITVAATTYVGCGLHVEQDVRRSGQAGPTLLAYHSLASACYCRAARA